MIPKGFKHTHFKQAIDEIDKDGIPTIRKSNRYDLFFDDRKYPPKYVISIANKYLNGVEWPSKRFNAVEAKNYFIRQGYTIIDKRKKQHITIIQSEDTESKHPEGAESFKLHRILERDTTLAKKAKSKRLQETGELRCDVCDFSFIETYGELGEGFIEAHHTIPVAKLKGDRKTQINELSLVCSNCHKMLHVGNPILFINELKEIIKK